MMRSLRPLQLFGLAVLMAASAVAHADQYRSETRELDQTPPEVQQKSEKELLTTTTDPYAKALLLRDLAAKAAQSGDPKKAAELIEQALAQKALSGIAAEQMQQQLTQLYLASGNLRKVIPQLQALVKNGNPSVETLMALGSAYLDEKRVKEALPLLREAMSKASAAGKAIDPSWRRAFAAALLADGNAREALPQLEKLLDEDPRQREDWLRLIASYLKTGNKSRAAAALALAGRLGYLQSPEDRLRLITLTAQIGAPFAAGSTMQKMMEAGELASDAGNWKLLASLWMAARESSLALSALDEAIRLAPSTTLYQQSAQLHMDREEYPAAARALEAAIGRGARDGKTLMALGMARYQQADIDGSIQAFHDAQAYPPTRALAAEWLKYLKSGKAREQALAAASERARRAGEKVQLGGLLGDSQVQLGQAPPPSAVQPGGLTPIGAEADGNADGTIPPWTGGLTRQDWPSGFRKGERLKDPFPNDKPVFTITAQNYTKYRKFLSLGHQALFARYPSYTMPVYRTRRSVSYPQAIYDATQANIGHAHLLGSDSLADAHLGFPFPKPESGVEIMWNHRTRYRGDTVQVQTTQAVVPTSGDPRYLKQTERVYFRYGNVSDPADLSKQSILLYYLTWFGATRNAVDFIALVHESANSISKPRAIWVMPPNIRRMFRIPPVGYDQPFPGSEGLMFIDMLDMYNGAFDRYVWKLVGKREMYIPYNAYRISDGSYRYAQLLEPYHFNQNATRYELHRVWVIEATQREGKRHSFGKRTFYVDEDSWNVVMVENDDHNGQLWRFQEGHLLPSYDIQAANSAPMLVYDLKDGRYFASRLSAEDDPPQYGIPMREGEFLPADVKAHYGR